MVLPVGTAVDDGAVNLLLGEAEIAQEGVGQQLQAVADRVGPTPEDLGQTDESVLAKWDRYKTAGRPWLTEIEVPG